MARGTIWNVVIDVQYGTWRDIRLMYLHDLFLSKLTFSFSEKIVLSCQITKKHSPAGNAVINILAIRHCRIVALPR
jgi:hypothetical protein